MQLPAVIAAPVFALKFALFPALAPAFHQSSVPTRDTVARRAITSKP